MKIDEAQICAELFAEQRRGIAPDEAVDTVRALLKEACKHFPGIIGDIEPGNMDRLFKFFQAIIVRLALEEFGEELARSLSSELGMDVVVVMAEFRREFLDNNESELPPEEDKRFRELLEGLNLDAE